MTSLETNPIRMQSEIDDILDSLSLDSLFLDDISPSKLNIAMINVGANTIMKFKLSKFNEDFGEKMENDSRFGFISLSDYKGTAPSPFVNSRILRLSLDGIKKYILMFENGSFQIMGCKKMTDAPYIINAIFEHLGMAELPASEFNTMIRMINTNFSLGCSINMIALHAELLKVQPSAVLDTDRHPGINIPIVYDGKRVVIIVFPKGNVIITGGKSIKQVDQAFRFITTFVNDNYVKCAGPPIVEVPKVPMKRGRKRKVDNNDFYASILL